MIVNKNSNTTKLMEEIFEDANHEFLTKNSSLFDNRVSERTLCGALMLELNKIISRTPFSTYYTDVEYNRNKNGKIKTINQKTIKNKEQIIKINCDLIVHSRGENIEIDNLIAIEMKKSTGNIDDKESDRTRLRCLTADTFDNIWSYDGKTLPNHVCRYKLGIYYEIDFSRKKIILEYYKQGTQYKSYQINFDGNPIPYTYIAKT